jgi:signal transduction histidine kinase
VFTAGHDVTQQYLARERLSLLNEASSRIGSTLDVVRTAEELTEVIVPGHADWVSVDLFESVCNGGEPPPTPLAGPVVLSRVAYRSSVKGMNAAVEVGQAETYPEFAPSARCLAAGRPMLHRVTDPEMARWIADSPARVAAVSRHGFHTVMFVPLRARGTTLGVAVIGRRTCLDPFTHDDLLLADELSTKAAMAIDNARRYTRERAARHAADVAAHEERRRVAVELHDTLGAMLFTLGTSIHSLGAKAGLDNELGIRLSAIEQQTCEASAALRNALRALSARPEQVALGVALREHCRDFSHRTDVTARMIILTALPTLPHSRICVLADAVREALLNAEKHARAQSVVISVFTLRGGVTVTVTDDGVGLDESRTRDRSPGLGLALTSERLARIGGSLTVKPNDDGGVTVQAWIPA